MTMAYAKQNCFSATCGDAASAARFFVGILLILGTVLSVSFFVSLESVILVLPVLGVLLLPIIILVLRGWKRPRNRQG